MLRANDRLTFSQDMALNHASEKVKPRCKLSYKLLKEKYVYDTLLDISAYTTLIQLKYHLDGIHHYITVVGKYIFDSSYIFALPLTKKIGLLFH